MDKDMLDLEEFEVVSLEENKDGEYLFNVKPRYPAEICPECGSRLVVNNGTYNRCARDIACNKHKAVINIMGNRHKCMDCAVTFCDTYKSVETNAKVTSRLKKEAAESVLNRPFLQIAEEYGITVPTVKRIFMEYAAAEEEKRVLYSPPVLGLAEVCLNKAVRSVIIDLTARRVTELLESSTKESIKKYLNSLPNPENIKLAVTDMSRQYREAVYECLPESRVVIDRYYVEKAVNAALENVRKRVRGESDGLPDKSERLKEAYSLKEDFCRIYLCKSRQEAESLYRAWRNDIPDHLPEYIELKKSFDDLHTEIFGFFDCESCTDGIAELMNDIIGSVTKSGRGCIFEIMRAKILLANSEKK